VRRQFNAGTTAMITLDELRFLFSYKNQSRLNVPRLLCNLHSDCELQIMVLFHYLPMADNKSLPVVAFQTRGLNKLQQNELVFILQFTNEISSNEDLQLFHMVFDQFCTFLKRIYADLEWKAREKNWFHSRRLTLFNPEKFCSRYRAFIYTSLELPQEIAITEPYSVVLGLTDEEYHFVHQYGISRLLAKRCQISKLYPFPPYNNMTKLEDLCFLSEFFQLCKQSILNFIYQLSSIPNIFIRKQRNGRINFEIFEDSHELLVQSLTELISLKVNNEQGYPDEKVDIPPDFAIQCEIGHPLAARHLVYSSHEKHTVSCFGSFQSNNIGTGGSFCIFSISDSCTVERSICTSRIEDGYIIACSATTWRHYIYKALVQKKNIHFYDETTKKPVFSILWIANGTTN
jgi:hypothetical protein